MSRFKFAPEQFLGLQELNRFQSFLTEGYRRSIVDGTGSFGIIKSSLDVSFDNFRLTAISNTTLSIATTSYAVDKDGLVVTCDPFTFTLPNANTWYWIFVSHEYSATEKGTVSIDAQGNVTGTGTKFLETVRGQPNFATSITFINSQTNLQTYQIIEVIDNENMLISGETFVETDLQYSVIGTFTPGTIQSTQDKYPFQYDSCAIDIVQELTLNTYPIAKDDKKFAIARVMFNGTSLIIEDKRVQIWTDKGVAVLTELPNEQSEVVGVDSVCWDSNASSGDQNIITVSWGITSYNFIIQSALRQITLVGGEGGRIKELSDLSSGDLNGWRVYGKKGDFCTILTSTKIGNQIQLSVDTLDPDAFESSDFLTVVPNCEQIEFFISDDNGGIGYVSQPNTMRTCLQYATFDIAIATNTIRVNNFATTFRYNIKYRYKSNNNYSSWLLFKNDPKGYLTEDSFDVNRRLKDVSQHVRRPYGVNPNGLLAFVVTQAPLRSYGVTFDTGTSPGLTELAMIAQGTIDLQIGVAKAHVIITGDVNLAGNVLINLDHYTDRIGKSGASFTIVIKGVINASAYSMSIVTKTAVGGANITVYNISATDVNYAGLLGRQLTIQCVYDGINKWVGYKVEGDNYRLGDVIMRSNIQPVEFDDTGKGIEPSTSGWALCNGQNGTVDLRSRFIVGYDDRITDPSNGYWDSTYNLVGTTGGQKAVQLTIDEIPSHGHTARAIIQGQFGLIKRSIINEEATVNSKDTVESGNEPNIVDQPKPIPLEGGDNAHENRPPFIVMAYLQRI
jgi:hypothetical protein